jgi:hypothetical protein
MKIRVPVLVAGLTFAAAGCYWGGYDGAHKSEGACAVSGGTVHSNGCVWGAVPTSATVQTCMSTGVDAYPELDDTTSVMRLLARSCGAGVSAGALYGWVLD